jgi:hypothetical protein
MHPEESFNVRAREGPSRRGQMNLLQGNGLWLRATAREWSMAQSKCGNRREKCGVSEKPAVEG